MSEIDNPGGDTPDRGPELLGKILRRAAGPRPPSLAQQGPAGASEPAEREGPGRIELLCAAEPDEASSPVVAVVPLVLAVEADRHPSDGLAAKPMERLLIVGRYPILVGRGPDMDVPVWDRSVSRRHAEIDWRDGGWAIRDLESTNGTRVNGSPLGPSEVRPLAAGDRIDLGFFARIAVRSLLPVLHPAGPAGEIRRLLDWAAGSTAS